MRLRWGVEIQQLRHLVSAVECGNLVRAAELCHISQSGLSRSIQALEHRLGVPLLSRTPRGVEPTAFGRSLANRARLILHEAERAVRELRSIEASESGELAFGITQNYGFTLIPELLAGFGSDHPGLRLHAVTAGFLDLASQVRTGRLEFAFGLLGPLDDASDLVVETLRDHHSRVLARTDHALVRPGPVHPADLAEARWATLDGVGFQRSFAAYFAAHGLPAPVQALTTDSIALIREVVTASDLLAVIPPDLVAGRVEAGRLGILDCEAPAEQTRIGLLTREGGMFSPHAARLTERIRAAVAPLHHHDTARPDWPRRTPAGA